MRASSDPLTLDSDLAQEAGTDGQCHRFTFEGSSRVDNKWVVKQGQAKWNEHGNSWLQATSAQPKLLQLTIGAVQMRYTEHWLSNDMCDLLTVCCL